MSEIIPSKTFCQDSAHGKYYITLTDTNKVTCHVANTSPCSRAAADTIVKLINLMLEEHMNLEDIIAQIKGIQCCPTINQANSTADAIARVLETHAVN